MGKKLLHIFISVVILGMSLIFSGCGGGEKNATPTTLALDNWHWRQPLPQGNNLTAICFGKDIFVAVGDYGTILTSSDRINWIKRSSGTTDRLNSVAFGNDIFIAVGENGTILRSTDGISWLPSPSAINGSLREVVNGNNTFIVVGDEILTSSDGMSWSKTSIQVGGFSIYKITYGNGIFVAAAVACGGRSCNFWTTQFATSSDGINWTLPPPNSPSNYDIQIVFDLTYGNGTFVALGDGGVFTSNNGVTWTLGNQMSPGLRGPLTFGNDRFVAFVYGPDGATVAMGTSPDGITWTITPASNPVSPSAIVYGKGLFVGVGTGGMIQTSTDGITWTNRSTIVTDRLIALARGNNAFVLVSDQNIRISSDGANWAVSTPEPPIGFQTLAYANNNFVAAGIMNNISMFFTSQDGINWTPKGQLPMPTGITYGNGTYVAVGPGRIQTSPDGVLWTDRFSDQSIRFYGTAFGNGIFIAVGDTILTSSDGIHWTQSNPPNYGISAIYANGIFVVGGERGTILTSPDGVTWTARNSGTNYGIRGIAFGDGVFVAVGDLGTILTSPDGINWTVRHSGTNNSLFSVAFGNNTFVAIGYGTILQSDPLQ